MKNTWKKLRCMLQSKISQSEKDTLSSQLYDILENKTTEIIKGSEIVIGWGDTGLECTSFYFNYLLMTRISKI